MRRAPHRITAYVTESAQAFSAFYRDCKVVGAAEEGATRTFAWRCPSSPAG